MTTGLQRGDEITTKKKINTKFKMQVFKCLRFVQSYMSGEPDVTKNKTPERVKPLQRGLKDNCDQS